MYFPKILRLEVRYPVDESGVLPDAYRINLLSTYIKTSRYLEGYVPTQIIKKLYLYFSSCLYIGNLPIYLFAEIIFMNECKYLSIGQVDLGSGAGRPRRRPVWVPARACRPSGGRSSRHSIPFGSLSDSQSVSQSVRAEPPRRSYASCFFARESCRVTFSLSIYFTNFSVNCVK